MKKTKLVLLTGSLVLVASCSTASYERTVSRSYDANGNLKGTVVTEHVSQEDPHNRMLLDVLDDQTYKK